MSAPASHQVAERVERLFESLRQEAEDDVFQQLIAQEASRVAKPMRLAVVGLIKAGKSTLINALLGEPLLPADVDETTYNLNWLRYGARRRLVAHWRDGAVDEVEGLDALVSLTKRAELADGAENLAYLEVFAPVELLKQIEIIDTPGLASNHRSDSARTEAFLRLSTETTEREAEQADALLFVFQKSLHEADALALNRFQGELLGRATPMNALGLLSMVDRYWPSELDPFDAGRRVAARLMETAPVKATVRDVLAVSGRLGLSARALDPAAKTALQQLCRLEEARFQRLLRNARRFVETDAAEIGIEIAARRTLEATLGLYGVAEARRLGAAENVDVALERLYDASGLSALWAVLTAHFGHRATLIKVKRAAARLRRAAFDLEKRAATPQEVGLARRLDAMIEAFELQDVDLLSYTLLSDLHAKALLLSPTERHDALRIAGEAGDALVERLNLASNTPPPEVLDVARRSLSIWRERANAVAGLSLATERAALDVCRLLDALVERASAEIA